jgi:DNA modification methylase
VFRNLIEIFTDEGDVVIDPVAGSGSTLIAAMKTNRKGFGFEIKKDFYIKAKEWIEQEKEQGVLFHAVKKTIPHRNNNERDGGLFSSPAVSDSDLPAIRD